MIDFDSILQCVILNKSLTQQQEKDLLEYYQSQKYTAPSSPEEQLKKAAADFLESYNTPDLLGALNIAKKIIGLEDLDNNDLYGSFLYTAAHLAKCAEYSGLHYDFLKRADKCWSNCNNETEVIYDKPSQHIHGLPSYFRTISPV